MRNVEVKITISVIALALLVCIAPLLLAKHPVPISANNWTGILNILCFLVHFIWASQSELSDLFFRTTICSSLKNYKSRMGIYFQQWFLLCPTFSIKMNCTSNQSIKSSNEPSRWQKGSFHSSKFIIDYDSWNFIPSWIIYDKDRGCECTGPGIYCVVNI